jgi:hypothetical protein
MFLITLAVLAMEQSVEAASQQQQVYEAVFRPLKKSERSYARLGPAGPYYPERAFNARTNGQAILRCRVAAAGELQNCKPVSEAPADSQFAIAARIMADRKRITVAGVAAAGETILVRVPFVLSAPAEMEP